MSENRLRPRVKPQALTKYDIAFFIEEKGSARWSHLLREFVENPRALHISRQKLSDYLKELCDEGLVQKTVDKKALALRMFWRVYPIYVVPKSRKKRIAEIRNKKEIYDFVDSASPEKIKKLHEAIAQMRETAR